MISTKPLLTINDIKEFEMDLTGTCNLECPICTRNYKHAEHLLKKNIRSLKEIIWQLDQFPNLNRIMLAGAVSEPTLYPEFLELIRYLNSRNIHIDLFTNGSTKDINFWEKVGKLLANGNKKNSCTITICGSTEDLHQKYRVGSSLEKILENLKAFKKYSSNDIIQFIEFEYNTEDINSSNLDYLKKLSTSWYIVQSEGRRRLQDFKKNSFQKKGIWPKKDTDKKYQRIFKKFFDIQNTKYSDIQCKSIQSKKLHIDQFGNIHSCYILMEFPESKDFYFYSSETFKKNIQNNKEILFDFTKIFDRKFDECKYCNKKIKKLINFSGLDFIC